MQSLETIIRMNEKAPKIEARYHPEVKAELARRVGLMPTPASK